jgi:hypothetical protein
MAQALGAGRIVCPIAVVDGLDPDPSLLRGTHVHGELKLGQEQPIGAHLV